MYDTKYFDQLNINEQTNIINKLKDLYLIENLSLNEVCEILNYKKTTIRVFM